MTAPRINLAALRQRARVTKNAGRVHVLKAEVLALVAAVEAARAYLAKYDASGPHPTTADLNPYSMRGRREALRAALAPFVAEGTE